MKWVREVSSALNMLAPHAIAMIIVGLYSFVQIHILQANSGIDSGIRDILMRSLGTLDASIGLVLSWYYGGMNKAQPPVAVVPPPAIPEKSDKT